MDPRSAISVPMASTTPFEIKYCFNKRMNNGRNESQEVLKGMGNLSGLGVGKYGTLAL